MLLSSILVLITIKNMKNNEKIANVIVLWLAFLGILFAASILGLAMSVIKAVAQIVGVETPF